MLPRQATGSLTIVGLIFCMLFVMGPGACPQKCVDQDGDGYGSPASALCSAPELDCNDNEFDANPGMSEGPVGSDSCSDGLDNDCNGLVDNLDPGCQGPDGPCSDPSAVVDFPDPDLEQCVRIVLRIPDGEVTVGDMERLTSLTFCSSDLCLGISDLTGLECSKLSELTLVKDQITDLDQLASLGSLESLSLYEYQTSDLSPLANLTNLKYLLLGMTQISDLGPLALPFTRK